MIANSADTTISPGNPDPDAPLSDDEFERGRGAYLVERARQAANLSQVRFGERYGIPVASVRDWEQGRRTPDSATQSYLRVIARAPDEVAAVLESVNLSERGQV